ncbi:hypothetical protein ROHU_016878 [Labeo rohita]|uniref:Uncharacterized protein n=1 Tax=Labeo rohita TaxID=84645 RepID=A0A498NIQ2_LABRO|nr:hypothetical protein ROHU_016878 [Labeo rohita]
MCRTDPRSAPSITQAPRTVAGLRTSPPKRLHPPPSKRDAEAPAGSRKLERGSGYGLRPGEGVCVAFFFQTSSLDPLPGRDKPKQGPWPAESPGDLCQQGEVTNS